MTQERTPWTVHSIMREELTGIDRRLANWPRARKAWRIPAVLISALSNAGLIFANMFCLNVVPYNLDGIVGPEALLVIITVCFSTAIALICWLALLIRQTLSQRVIVPELFSGIIGFLLGMFFLFVLALMPG